MNPKVSIIMSVFNQQNFLSGAIESILKQKYSSFEFLIIDDNSNDNSLEILKNYKDKRIKIFKNLKRKGLAKNLNFLINKSQGQYIARMDGDDISEPARIQEQASFLDNHREIAFVGSWAQIINNNNKKIGELHYPTETKNIRKTILSYNPFVHSSVMFRKKILNEVRGYDESLFYCQDYDLFLRLIAKYDGINIPKFLHKFRWLPNYHKQKQQHLTALRLRVRAISEYGYSKWESVKLVKPLVLSIIPIFLKKIYWRLKYK